MRQGHGSKRPEAARTIERGRLVQLVGNRLHGSQQQHRGGFQRKPKVGTAEDETVVGESGKRPWEDRRQVIQTAHKRVANRINGKERHHGERPAGQRVGHRGVRPPSRRAQPTWPEVKRSGHLQRPASRNSAALRRFAGILRKPGSIVATPPGQPTPGKGYLNRARSSFTFWAMAPIASSTGASPEIARTSWTRANSPKIPSQTACRRALALLACSLNMSKSIH